MEKDTIGFAWRNDSIRLKEQEIMIFLYDENNKFFVSINDPNGKDQIFTFRILPLAKKFLLNTFPKLEF